MTRLATALTSFFTLFALIALSLIALSTAPPAQAQDAGAAGPDPDGIIEGIISVKFEAPATAAIEAASNARGVVTRTNAQGIIQTGLAAVDQLNQQFGVVGMERIFRPAGRFEARHREFGLHRWYEIEFAEGSAAQTVAGVRSAVEAYAANANVTIAELDLEKEIVGFEQGEANVRPVEVEAPAAREASGAMDVTNDPFYIQQWHYNNTGQVPPGGTPDADIDLPEGHDLEMGIPSVVVSIHDAGLDVDHEDLEANIWINEDEIPGNGIDDDNNGFVDDYHGYNFAQDQGEIVAGSHGTHVGGTVAAMNNNGIGVAGVAGGNGSEDSGARIMSAQVFSPSGAGGFPESYPYAADNGAIISQNSWGYDAPAGYFEQDVLDAIDYYVANAGTEPDAPMQGGLVVFSAGNTYDSGNYYPGFYAPTIAVAATDHHDEKADYSTYGEWVDVSAPGGFFGGTYDEDDVFSTYPNDQYGYSAGTSMAAPHASGVLALIVSAVPGMTNDQVREQLESTTDDIYDVNPGFIGLLGTGRISAGQALQALDPDDETPPDAITDLAATVAAGGNSVELTWTAPADDAGDPESGPVASYQIAYSDEGPIESADDFDNATGVADAPQPLPPGEEQGALVTDLEFGVQYWFAVRAIDDNSNTSLSNSPSATTNPAPELAYSPDVLEADMELNDETIVPLTLSNVGPAGTELNFTFPAFAADALLARTPASRHNDVSRPIADASHAKGEDPYSGAGHPVILGAGGPDAFGYQWIDSNEPGGPTFNWVDISDIGTALALSDESEATVELPFNFEFYGDSYTEVTIGSNGALNFAGADSDFTNDPIPDTGEPNALVAAYWEDLNPGAGGTVYYYEDTANNRFIVQYTDVPHYFDTGANTFQVILDESGSILFQYLEMTLEESATVGIENAAGDVGLQVAYNTAYVEDNLAVAIAAEPEFIAGVDPVSGTIASGSDLVVDVTFNTSEVDEPGLYQDDLTVETNDPGNQLAAIPAEVTVSTGPPAIAVRPDEVNFGEVLVGATELDTFYIVNEGGGPLEVASYEVDNDDFEVGVFPPSPPPIIVPFGDSVGVQVSFTPDDLGVETATVTIESDDPEAGTVTVSLEGEGVPAPVIATSPDSLSETLEVGETATDILTVSNEGGSDLDFEALFVLNPGENLTRADVAAPFSGAATGQATGAVASAQPAGSAPGNTQPLDPMDAVYQIDDGTSENALGFGGLGDEFDAMWMNAFEVVEGAGTITTISTTWGAAGSANVPPAGKVGTAYVYEDPNDDGDPSDAVLLSQTSITVQDPGTNNFTTVSITPTPVEGTFFIAVLLENNDPDTFPMPMDESSTYQGASWAVADTDGDGFDDEDLTNNSTPPTELGALGFPANWLLRADGGASFVAVSPSEGTVAPGGSQDLTVTYDATGLAPDLYVGDVTIISNDPANPVDLTPTTLEVLFGDPAIAVDPEAIDYGEVLVGATASETVTIFNDGNAPLEITDISSDSDAFTADFSGSFTIALGDSAQVDVIFSPDAVQSYSGTLSIESSDPENATVTVALSGEGVPAPVIAVTPDSLYEAVEIGQTATDTLTITNEGGSDLDFFVNFDVDPSELTRDMVAAPAPSGLAAPGEQAAAMVAAAAAPGSAPSNTQPLDPMDATYQIDDGTSENALGLGGLGDIYDMMWLNAFEVIEGEGTITSISTAWGCAAAICSAPVIPEGKEGLALIYEDPNDDGDPSDAVLLSQTSITVQDPGTDAFTTVSITPTEVEGTFFIAVLLEEVDPNAFPAPMDESSPYQNSSWFVGTATGEDFNIEDLSANSTPPTELGSVGFPANWLLRADTGEGDGGGGNFPDWITVVPFDGTVAPGESQDLTVTYDADGLDIGLYTGDIEISSNDPETPVAEVPTTLEVTTAPYPFDLDPDEINVTIDLTQGDSTTTEEFSIENITDEEQFFLIETRGASGEAPLFQNFISEELRREYEQRIARLIQFSAGQQSAETSMGVAPGNDGPRRQAMAPFARIMAPTGVTAWSTSVFGDFADQFVSFDLGEPQNMMPFGSSPTTYAGDYVPGDDETFYIINDATNAFLAVNQETGETTQVGTSTPNGEQTWSELAGDPTDGTLYGSAGSATASTLYTIDPETGEATEVAPITSGGSPVPFVIAIAIDGDGQMWGYEISNDTFLQIDKETGAATVVGPIGFDANFAQGMDYDLETGTMYMAAYRSISIFSGVGELRTVDLETGMTTLVGTLGPNGDELGYLALPSGGFMFLDTDLISGTLAPFGEVTLDLNFDAGGLLAGTYEAELVVISDEPGMPEDFIPVTLTVIDDPEATLQPLALDFGEVFVGGDTTQTITLMNTGGDDLEVSDIQLSPGVFSIPDTAQTSFTLEPTEAETFFVTFSPDAVQSYDGSFTVISDDPDGNVSATLEGEGIPAPAIAVSPESFDLTAFPGEEFEETLNITNTGGSPLTYTISGELVGFEGPEQNIVFEDVILEEDFNEGIPADWNVVDAIEGSATWDVNTTWDDGNYTGGDGLAAASSTFPGFPDPYDTRLVTPEITASVEGYTLEFKANYQAFGSDSLDVDITTDGGASWTTIASYFQGNELGTLNGDGAMVDLSLAPFIDAGDTFQLRWRYYNTDGSADWYAQIDDVVISRELEFLTINPAAGTVAPSETDEVTLSFDTEGLSEGTYEVDLNIASNDPTADTTVVPVTLDIIESLTITPEPGPDSTRTVLAGSEFLVPITAEESLDGLDVESYQFTLTFDEELFAPVGVETDGTLSEDVTLAVNTTVPGQISVAAADTDGTSQTGTSQDAPVLFTIEGEGTLIYVRLEATGGLGASELAFTEFLFNEGDPPATTETTTYEVEVVYGDVSGNGEVTATDASLVLQYVVGLIDFGEAQLEAGDVSGDGSVSALDASLILRYVIDEIDCFPVEEGCQIDGMPALALRADGGGGQQPAGALAWGESESVDQVAAPTAGVGEGQLVSVPLALEQAAGPVRAVQLTAEIDPEKASVEGVEADGLPEGWVVTHHTSEEGMLRIAMAGSEPLSEGQIATLRLRLTERAGGPVFSGGLTLEGQVQVNEAEPAQLQSAQVEAIPEEFEVSGNYPNPHSGRTEIALNLPADAQVTLEVYDALGRRVMRLGRSMEAGTGRTLEIEARSLPAGVYFYRITAETEEGRQTDSGQMVLVK